MVVSQERSGWRDEWISQKHRDWGFNCPAVDIDFLVIEYDFEVPRALIEYKYITADLNKSKSGIRALMNLANIAKVPFFIVIYNHSPPSFKIIPKNKYAQESKPEKTLCLTEYEYVSFLYELRGRSIPANIYEKLFGDN